MVRKAYWLRQKLKLAYSGSRVIRRMDPLVCAVEGSSIGYGSQRCRCCFSSANCAVHGSFRARSRQGLCQPMEEKVDQFLTSKLVMGRRQSEGLDAHFDNRVLMFPSVIAIVVALTIFSVKNGLLEKGSQRPRNDSVIW